jgi:hypothetical protein
MSNLHINVFDGAVRFDNLKIYEAKSNSLFVECQGLYLNLSVYKLWAGKYDITELKINHPVVNIIQHGNHFNYDDIIKTFTENKPDEKEKIKNQLNTGSVICRLIRQRWFI